MESESIQTLLEKGSVVISTGGGGIPVVRNDQGLYRGVAAVIDKDRSALQLAKDIDADVLVILTDVSNVYINYGQKNQEKLESTLLRKHRNICRMDNSLMGVWVLK